MSHLITIGDKRIVSGRVTIPLFGTWSADVALAEPDKVTGSSSFVMADLTMKCFARPARAGVYAGKAANRIVGGNGGLNKIIAPKGYSHSAGVKLGSLLQDAAKAAGESIIVEKDKVIGAAWARKRCRASSVLRMLIDGKWWMDEAGVMQTKARPSTKITTPFQVIDYKPNLALIEVATESFKNWMPGRTFEFATLPSVQTISSVSFIIADGKIRTLVTTSDTQESRLIQDIRSIVRDEMFRAEFGAPIEYEITKAAENLISAKPTAGKDSPWPALADIKLAPGLFGESVTPTVGAKCRIVFLDSDPSLYRCIGIDGLSQKTTFASSGNIEATAGGIFKVNGGEDFAAHAAKVDARFDAIEQWAASVIFPTGIGPTGTAIPPLQPGSSTKCTKLKTD